MTRFRIAQEPPPRRRVQLQDVLAHPETWPVPEIDNVTPHDIFAAAQSVSETPRGAAAIARRRCRRNRALPASHTLPTPGQFLDAFQACYDICVTPYIESSEMAPFTLADLMFAGVVVPKRVVSWSSASSASAVMLRLEFHGIDGSVDVKLTNTMEIDDQPAILWTLGRDGTMPCSDMMALVPALVVLMHRYTIRDDVSAVLQVVQDTLSYEMLQAYTAFPFELTSHVRSVLGYSLYAWTEGMLIGMFGAAGLAVAHACFDHLENEEISKIIMGSLEARDTFVSRSS